MKLKLQSKEQVMAKLVGVKLSEPNPRRMDAALAAEQALIRLEAVLRRQRAERN